MKKLVVLVGVLFLLSGCGRIEQMGSHMVSSVAKLNRRITLYGAMGVPVRQWEGNYSVEIDGGTARFMHKGKAVIINGSFTIEEI